MSAAKYASRPAPIGPYDAQEHPPAIIAKVADALGLSALPEPAIAWWSLNIQSVTLPDGAQRRYGVVTHNPTHPRFLVDAAARGELPDDLAAAFVALAAATGIVITDPAAGPVIVLRRAMPPLATSVAWSVDSCDPRTGRLSTIHEASIPSVSQLVSGLIPDDPAALSPAILSLSLHPRIEGVKVYIWMHAGSVLFSTRRTVAAGHSRAAEGARLTAELWYACGGVPIQDLFPPALGPNGGGLARCFIISHPSVCHTTKVPIGGGFITYLGSVAAATGEVLLPGDARAAFPLPLEVNESGFAPPPPPPPSAGWSTVARECEKVARGGSADGQSAQNTIPELDEQDAIEAASEHEHNLLVQNASGYAAPFVAPAGRARSLALPGSANESVRRCLFGPYAADTDYPRSICGLPNFASAAEASAHMMEGYWTDARATARGVDPQRLAAAKARLFTSPGESVIVRATFAAPQFAPFGAASFQMRLVPAAEVYRLGIFGSGTNVQLRAHELRTMSDQALGSVLEQQARGPGCFPEPFHTDLFFGNEVLRRLITRRDGAGIQSLSYARLVGLPAMDSWVRGLATEGGRGVLAALASEISQSDDPPLELPRWVYEKLAECSAFLGPRRLHDHEVRTILFGNACLRLALAGTVSCATSALRAFTVMESTERDIAVFAATTLAPLLGRPPSREKVAEVYAALRSNESLVDARASRVKPRVAALVEVAQSVSYRMSLGGESDPVAVALSAVRIRGGEELYGMNRHLPAVRAALAAFPRR